MAPPAWGSRDADARRKRIRRPPTKQESSKGNRMKHAHHVLIRWPTRLLRGVAWLVIVCFTVNTITPGMLGAQTLAKSLQVTVPPARTDLELVSDTLGNLEDLLARMDRRANGKFEYAWQEALARRSRQAAPVAATRSQLGPLQAEVEAALSILQALQPSVQSAFADDEARLRDARIPADIVARAATQQAQYARLYEQLRSSLDAMRTAKSAADYKQALANAHAFLAAHSSKGRHAAFDPARPAFATPSDRVREPMSTAETLHAALAAEGAGKRASSRSAFSGAVGASASTANNVPPDLAPTEDVQITDAIRAKASELHNNPIEIYQWVNNAIEFVPTYGSIQGSAYALKTLRGNAFDQATLLIALLRAANVRARYVYGTVEIPVDQVMNWIGGVTSPTAALNLLGQGGIPAIGLSEGGVIKRIRMEHVWVEAFIDYTPSRGAKNGEADTWIALDPSFKQYAYAAPMVGNDVIGDPGSVASDYLHSATVSADGGSVTGLDANVLGNAYLAYAQRLEQAIRSSGGSPTVFDLYGSRKIVERTSPILPAGLAYGVRAVGNRYDALPASLRAYANIELYSAPNGFPGDSPILSYRLSLPSFGEGSLTLNAEPASARDAQVWDSYAASSDFPPYLVNVVETLKLNGAVLGAAPSMTLGNDLQLNVSFTGAAPGKNATFSIISGDAIQVGINPAGMPTSSGRELAERSDLGSADGNLYLHARTHWMAEDFLNEIIARMTHTLSVRLPSVGVFAAPLTVAYRFGIPSRATYRSREVDIKLSYRAAVAMDGSAEKQRRYVEQTGLVGSMLEGAVPEALFSKPLGFGSNSATLLNLANEQGIPLHFITSANASSQMPQLNHSPEVMNDISNAIAAGYTVLIPRTSQTNGQWSGSGYIMRDPRTGAGDYRISGGLSGDAQTDCGRSTRPVPVEYPAMSIVSLLLLAASPIILNDDDEISGLGVAALVIGVLAIVLTAGGAGVAAAAVEAVGAIGMRVLIALALFFGFEMAAFAGEDGCSCEPKPRCPHRGGHAYHDHCADVVPPNDHQGCDVDVEGKGFDAQAGQTLWEIKTGSYSSYPEFLKNVVLTKNLAEFQLEKEKATACGFSYTFGTTDGTLASAMRAALPGDASSVRTISCSMP